MIDRAAVGQTGPFGHLMRSRYVQAASSSLNCLAIALRFSVSAIISLVSMSPSRARRYFRWLPPEPFSILFWRLVRKSEAKTGTEWEIARICYKQAALFWCVRGIVTIA